MVKVSALEVGRLLSDDAANEYKRLVEQINALQRLYDLMQVKVNSLYARRQIDEEIQSIMQKTEIIQTERDKLITSVERSNLDKQRLTEIQEFVNTNNPNNEFDETLFRKLVRHIIVHSRREVEFVLYSGISRRVVLRAE